MAKYDVYGVGNALLDMVYEVDAEFLKNQKIEKGLMTLIDEDKQNELLKIVKDIKGIKSCGGSAANTVIGVCQMGGKAFYSCKVADDDYGKKYFEDLTANGLDSNLADGLMDGTTGKCVVFITPDADRTMNTYLGITEKFSVDELREDKIKDSKFVYIEGYLVTSETGKAAAIEAKKIADINNIKTAITLSDPGIVNFFKDGFKEIIGDGVDLLFCNEEEALSFTGANTVHDSIHILKKYAKTFVITLGPKGVLVYDGNQQTIITGNKVEAIDTNGAGDLFAGAFLYALTQGNDYSTSARLANAASAKLVTKPGARLEIEDALKVRKEILGA